MALSENYGVNFGRVLVQHSGSIGGKRYVFVKQQGQGKNELVFPTFGCRLLNPFKGVAKFYAGDLVEYRIDGTGYILKTYEVAENAEASATDVYIVRDGFRHIPFVGDILMKAPTSVTGTGTAHTVTAVEETSSNNVNYWKVTFDVAIGALTKGDVLVEGASAGASKKMLVQNPNMQLPWDMDCVYNPANTTTNNDFENAKYLFDPILSELSYVAKMSPIPSCVKALNKSRVDGWFQI